MSVHTAAQLVEQFYEWEGRGRGWFKADFVVDLEPPFEPFWGHFFESLPIIDDGKRPSFFAQLFASPSEPITEPERRPEFKPYAFDDNTPLVVYSVRFSQQSKPLLGRMEQLLVMLSHTTDPISFEIIATSETIAIQLTCRQHDSRYIHDQCKAFFPDGNILEAQEDAVLAILETEGGCAVVDFGLCDEFMMPLAIGEHECYTALFGILNHLEANESLIYQVLFSGVCNPWAKSILTAVCDESGKQSFFVDVPEMPQLARQKVQAPLCAATVRMLASADTGDEASRLLLRAATTIMQASKSAHNSLQPLEDEAYTAIERITDIARRRSHRLGMLLNTAELAALAHFPNIASKKLHQQHRTTKAPNFIPEDDEYMLGMNIHQGIEEPVYLSMDARLRHIHILGATGTGKSTLLHCLISQDIYNFVGCCILDPHGDLIDNVLAYIPEHRIDDVIIIDPTDHEYTIPFNILSAHSEFEKELLASDLVGLFKRFSTSFGDQMHSVLANAILALLYNNRNWHLGDLKRFLVEPAYRGNILSTVTDTDILYYWQQEFSLLKGGSIGPLITRLDSFLRPKAIRHMLCQKESLDLSDCMDNHKVILVKLPRGLIGEENSYLLGALIIARLQQCAMARQAQTAAKREPFFIYIDEFHHFISPSMASILSGARKYGVGLVLAHQDMQQVTQVDSGTANSVMSNAYTRICFRLSDTDAKRMQENVASFSVADFQQLDIGEAIGRVGAIDNDFSLDIYPFVFDQVPHFEDAVVQHSRLTYGVPITAITISEPLATPTPQTILRPEPKTDAKLQAKAEPSSTEELREHRYLQEFIKRMAQEFGYIATIECPTPDGKGLIDLVLEKEQRKIAVEISVSTDVAWEIHNLQKCLTAGFKEIVLCSKDATKLSQIAKAAEAVLPLEEAKKVRYLNPQDIVTLFNTDQSPTESVTVMKGYRVKVQYDSQGSNKNTIVKSIVSKGAGKKS